MREEMRRWLNYYRSGRERGLSVERANFHADRMFYEAVIGSDWRLAYEAREAEIAALGDRKPSSHSESDA